MCATRHYGLYMSTQAQARVSALFFSGACGAAHVRPLCVSSQPGHPAGDSSSIT